jgi:hypothetical protein
MVVVYVWGYTNETMAKALVDTLTELEKAEGMYCV